MGDGEDGGRRASERLGEAGGGRRRRRGPGWCRPGSPGSAGRSGWRWRCEDVCSSELAAGSELSQLQLGAVTVPAHHPSVAVVTVENLERLEGYLSLTT